MDLVLSSKNMIKVSNISRVLSTRITAKDLFFKLNKEKKEILDFTDVEMVSRSFANEWLDFEKKHKFKRINMNPDVSFMFKCADKKMNCNILKKSKFRTVSIDELLSEA